MGVIDMVLNNYRCREAVKAGNSPEWIRNSPRRRYIEALLLSTPPWVVQKHRSDLRRVQRKARWETVMNHRPWHVGHIVPLRHPMVCGLTVPANLRAEPGDLNLRRGNDCPEISGQMELEL